MKSVDVTISIVSYNTADLLIRCLSSIYKHTKNVTFEIVVVDNNSSDDSVKRVKQEFPEVKIIENRKNKFFARANNQALEVARGKYFLLLAPDAYLKNNAISKLVEYLENNLSCGAVEGLEIYENEKLIPNGSRHVTPLLDFYELSIVGKHFKDKKKIKDFRLARFNRKSTFSIDVGCDAFLMIRTDVFRKIKGYDPKLLMYYTENDICLRIQKEGYTITHLGDSYVYHRVTAIANTLKWRKLDIYYNDLLTYYKKNGYFLSGYLLFILLKTEQVLLRVFRPHMFG